MDDDEQTASIAAESLPPDTEPEPASQHSGIMDEEDAVVMNGDKEATPPSEAPAAPSPPPKPAVPAPDSRNMSQADDPGLSHHKSPDPNAKHARMPIFKKVEPNFSAGKPSRLPKELLMRSDGIIPTQSGTNQYASQKEMTAFGAIRDVKNKIKCSVLTDLTEEMQRSCEGVLRLQCGTNKFASQAGITGFGSPRDVMYHEKGHGSCEDLPEEKRRLGDGIIRLQSGTNKLASQKDMTAMGAPRGVIPLGNQDAPEQDPNSQGFIHLQMGTNRFESQAGMTGFGSPRTQITKYKDDQRGELPYDESTLPKQNIGSSGHDSQAGMTAMGAFRMNLLKPGQGIQDRLSQGIVPYQMGINWADSQAGKTGFGQPRQVQTPFVDDTHPDLPENIATDPELPRWTLGSIGCATQEGMTAMGSSRDVKGIYLRRLW